MDADGARNYARLIVLRQRIDDETGLAHAGNLHCLEIEFFYGIYGVGISHKYFFTRSNKKYGKKYFLQKSMAKSGANTR